MNPVVETRKNSIVISKEYFDNINTVITSINTFFSSNFKTRNFPVADPDFQVDTVLINIISWFNSIDPTWLQDPENITKVLDMLEEAADDVEQPAFDYWQNSNDTKYLDYINAFVGYKVLQFISMHFNEFNILVNAIYSFELFTTPSKYKDVIELFSQNIPLDEIENIMGDNQYSIFSTEKYVHGVFNNTLITLPETLKIDTEISRFDARTDLNGIEIFVDDTIQEAAEINMFDTHKPAHIKYDKASDTFKVSKQFTNMIEKFISELGKCNTVDDLVGFFSNEKNFDKNTVGMFIDNVIPCILSRVYNNNKKYPFDNFNVDALSKYIKSYKSIVNKNAGAKRFANYDIFSTFKTDKTATLTFLKDFLTINLYNNKSGCPIANNVLLTIFNIFDSRIYLDTLYNLIPEDVKKKKYPTEDLFVKTVRAKINQASRSANPYGKKVEEKAVDTESLMEYALDTLKDLGEMSLTDMQFCESFHSVLDAEISCLGDVMYNKGTSQLMIDHYIGESYTEIIQEGFFSKLIQKSKDKKTLKNIEEIESAYNISLPEEFKNIITTNSGVFGICLYDLNTFKENMCEFETRTLFPIGNLFNVGNWISDFEKYSNIPNLKRVAMLYGSENGEVYTKFFTNGRSRLEKIADTISEYASTILNKPFIPVSKDEITSRNVMYVFNDNGDSFKSNVEFTISTKGTLTFGKYYKYISFITYTVFNSDEDLVSIFGDKIYEFLNNNGIMLNLDDVSDIAGMIHITNFIYHDTYVEYIFNIGDNRDISICQTLNEDGELAGKTEISFTKDKTFTEYYIQESVDNGNIPSYMRDRMAVSDDNEKTTVTPTEVDLPPDVPSNGIDELADSIDTKLDTGGDTLDTALGSGYTPDPNKKAEGQVVYNITNNYTNSFNKDSNNKTSHIKNDLSTGKTTTINNTNSNNDSSTNKVSDSVIRKRNKTNNNYNNGEQTDTSDTKETKNTDITESYRLSSGYTMGEIRMFLESEEPLSDEKQSNAGKPPKGDLLTKAMDVDRKTLSTQQKMKRGAQKAVNTVSATLKPVKRTKLWLTGIINSLIKRDEDKVKAEIVENPSYRTALYKATRLAIKFGLTGVAFTISGYLGAAYLVVQGAKAADKQRLKKEVQEEFSTELEILEDKIKLAEEQNTPESNKAKWQMMRLKSKMEHVITTSPKSKLKGSRSIY